MRKTKNEGFIFNYEGGENAHRLIAELKRLNIAHKTLHKLDNTIKEINLLMYVETNKNNDINTINDFVRSHCLNTSQNYLHVSASRKVQLMCVNGDVSGIGTLQSVLSQIALTSKMAIYCPKTETYFTIKGGDNILSSPFN